MRYLFISFRKSTLPQNRQLIVLISYGKPQVDNFVGNWTFRNHSIDTLFDIKPRLECRAGHGGEAADAVRPHAQAWEILNGAVGETILVTFAILETFECGLFFCWSCPEDGEQIGQRLPILTGNSRPNNRKPKLET